MSISKENSWKGFDGQIPTNTRSGSYHSMMNNNNNNITTLSSTSTGSSASNSSMGSTGAGTGAPMSLAAANVVRGIMEKVLATPPMGAGISAGLSSASSASAARLFNELDYLSSPGLDSDFGDTSPLLCGPGPSGSSSSSNLSNQYLRLAISGHNNNSNNSSKEASHYGFGNSHHSNLLSR